MAKKSNILQDVLIRYVILLLVTGFITFFQFFNEIMLKLTIYPIGFILNFFYDTIVFDSFLLIESTAIELIPACIAISAYLLLFILNLTTPMTLKMRFKSLAFSFIVLLLANISRITILSVLFVQDYAYFEIVHKFIWYFISTLFVVGIWFVSVTIFKIGAIPIYTDFKTIIKKIKWL